jgi:peptidoglycan hydrolase CwlO-like protein
MELGSITNYALITLIISGVLQWIREWKKHSTWSKNGDDLKEIKADVKTTHDKIDCLDKKVGEAKVKIVEVKTVVNEQKAQCGRTVKRFDKTIGDQNQQIIDLARNSGGRR